MPDTDFDFPSFEGIVQVLRETFPGIENSQELLDHAVHTISYATEEPEAFWEIMGIDSFGDFIETLSKMPTEELEDLYLFEFIKPHPEGVRIIGNAAYSKTIRGSDISILGSSGRLRYPPFRSEREVFCWVARTAKKNSEPPEDIDIPAELSSFDRDLRSIVQSIKLIRALTVSETLVSDTAGDPGARIREDPGEHLSRATAIREAAEELLEKLEKEGSNEPVVRNVIDALRELRGSTREVESATSRVLKDPSEENIEAAIQATEKLPGRVSQFLDTLPALGTTTAGAIGCWGVAVAACGFVHWSGYTLLMSEAVAATIAMFYGPGALKSLKDLLPKS